MRPAHYRLLALLSALLAVALVPLFRLIARVTPGLEGWYETHHMLTDTLLAGLAGGCGALATYALLRRAGRPLERLEAGLSRLPHAKLAPVGVAHIDRAVEQINALLDLEAQAQQLREREHLQLARGLHDGVLQDIVGARFALARGDAAAALEALERASGSLRDGIRHIAPPELEVLGLRAALEDRAEMLGLQLSATGLEDVPKELQLEVYRLAEHALVNALRHGEARSVRLRYRHGELRVLDDGRGCGEDPRLGLGLKLAQAQLRLRGGDLSLRPLERGSELRLWWA
ncbi:two-component system sensor histidine kinase UhpB [Deinobacterium chartae]|uniref:histidine kinase n=1 Tax=Deinobacterium chartae TaxID=521158 RepID=A0A841HX83_9DEIO|nr:hypothetical protein [Deinobacterium chartae]MBB6096859.1 two-component system sensor histidine kinase UhpB [Deinobacterium chartae]